MSSNSDNVRVTTSCSPRLSLTQKSRQLFRHHQASPSTTTETAMSPISFYNDYPFFVYTLYMIEFACYCLFVCFFRYTEYRAYATAFKAVTTTSLPLTKTTDNSNTVKNKNLYLNLHFPTGIHVSILKPPHCSLTQSHTPSCR